MQIIFHGHACVEIEHNNKSILIDPFISQNPQCTSSVEEITAKNIAYILVTHWHDDHTGDAVNIAKIRNIPIISTLELCRYFSSHGAPLVTPLHIGWKIIVDNIAIKATIAHHGGWIEDTNLFCTPCWFLIERDGKKVYHAGDTALTKDFELLTDEKIDVALLPIGDTFTMGPKDALIATKMIRPKIIVPIHYNTWPTISQDGIEFARTVMLDNLATPKPLWVGQFIHL